LPEDGRNTVLNIQVERLTMISPSLLAQALPSASSGVDWLYQFTNNLTNLTTQNGGALTQLGIIELSCIALFTLVSMVVNWNTSGMTLRFHTHPVRAGDLTHFLLRLILCSLLINYWVNPFPGASFGINHFFSYIAQAMVAAFDQSSLDNLLQLLKTAGDGTAMPSLMAPMQILCYFYVQGLLGLASAILFVINCSSFILYGVTALFGPVFIPLLMTQTFRAKFFHFLDVLISFAMIRAVAAAFIFVWSGFMNTFIQQTFNGTYSIAMWLANLIPCTMVFIAFIINMLFIPSMTQAIFGGAAGLTSAATRLAGGAAATLAIRS
jgi:type IV secretion system protein VirB6